MQTKICTNVPYDDVFDSGLCGVVYSKQHLLSVPSENKNTQQVLHTMSNHTKIRSIPYRSCYTTSILSFALTLSRSLHSLMPVTHTSTLLGTPPNASPTSGIGRGVVTPKAAARWGDNKPWVFQSVTFGEVCQNRRTSSEVNQVNVNGEMMWTPNKCLSFYTCWGGGCTHTCSHSHLPDE